MFLPKERQSSRLVLIIVHTSRVLIWSKLRRRERLMKVCLGERERGRDRERERKSKKKRAREEGIFMHIIL